MLAVLDRDDHFEEVLANLKYERLLVDQDLRRLVSAATYLGKQLSKLTTSSRCPVRHLKHTSEKTKNCHRRSASSSNRRMRRRRR